MGKIKVRIISMITILCMMISAIEFDSFAQTQEKTLALEQMDAGEDDSLFTVSCGDENFVNEETPVDEEDLESDDNIETYSEEELPDYVILQDDVYVNTCENFSETRSYEGYEFSNIRFTMSNGMAYFKGTVKIIQEPLQRYVQ